MGWLRLHEDPSLDEAEHTYDHEGYVIALVRDGRGWRQLSMADDDRCVPVDEHGIKASLYLQVACECGWRSQRFFAPLGTDWMPFCVIMPDHRFDDAAADLWAREHRDLITPSTAGENPFSYRNVLDSGRAKLVASW